MNLMLVEWLREGWRRWEYGVMVVKRGEEFREARRRKARMAVGRRVRQFERDGLVRGWVRWVRYIHSSAIASVTTEGKEKEVEGREKVRKGVVMTAMRC